MNAPEQKIIFLATHSSPGGIQELWANLAEQLRLRGYDTEIVALYPPNSRSLQPTPTIPWKYIVSQTPTGIFGVVNLLFRLRNKFKSQEVVVVTAMPAANVIASLAAFLGGSTVNVILTHHSPSGTHSKALNFIDGITGSFANVKKIVCVSNAVKDSFASKPLRYVRKLATIYNALPPQLELDLAAYKSARAPRDFASPLKVVSIGRLAPQKNYPLLIRAAVHLPNVEFHIVGGGPDEMELKEYAKEMKVQDRITFWGHLARAEALKMIADAEVFLQPSLFEGHSLALIEAAKLGLPLIVSNMPSQVEGSTGPDRLPCAILVDINDDLGLSREIENLASNESYFKTWASRAETLADMVSFPKTIGAYEDIIKDIKTRASALRN